LNKFNSLALGLAGVAVIGLGAVTATFAAPGDGPPAGGPAAAEHGGMRMDPAQWQARMQQRAEAHAQHMRAVLQLRPDQEPALQALMASMRPPEGMRGPGMRGMGGPGMRGDGMRGEGRETLTTPQRLDRMAQRMEQHQRAFQIRADAIRRFYAQLSPSQQAAFDALPMGPPMGMGGHGGGHHGMMGGRGMRGGPGMQGGMGMHGGTGGPGMDGGPPGIGGRGPDDGSPERGN
jgi:protein CpxP